MAVWVRRSEGITLGDLFPQNHHREQDPPSFVSYLVPPSWILFLSKFWEGQWSLLFGSHQGQLLGVLWVPKDLQGQRSPLSG
uniref:Uncharacterized protein n=1 Tax=Anguilla anguilla TaxID=7936 RepID=A0A0E9W9Y4_ANGAN